MSDDKVETYAEVVQGQNIRTQSVPHVVTILVNWRAADDTIECIGSLLASDHGALTIVVVDNGSGDGSMEKIASWAQGRWKLRSKGPTGLGMSTEGAARPVTWRTISYGEGCFEAEWSLGVSLYLIDTKKNLGFAGGVNVGIEFALHRRDVEYVWVLNNDTVVRPDCLGKLLERARESDIGMCGCRVLYYHEPESVQALGGATLSLVLGRSRLLGAGQPASDFVDPKTIEKKMDHLCGVSMLVSRAFLNVVGSMDDGYFLYYEEADWAERGKGKFKLGYADSAIVYHKEGRSIGSHHDRKRRSVLSSYFLVRSRIRFVRRFYPWALPTVLAYSLALAVRAYWDGQHAHGRAIVDATCGRVPKNLILPVLR